MNQPTSPLRPSASRKRTILIVAAVLIVLAAFAAYAYIQRQNSLHNDSVVVADNDDTKIDSTINLEKMTTDLPNGTTAIYDNTDGNRSIIFAESEKGMDYVDLSHSGVEDFLRAADTDVVTRLCGANGERAEIENVIVATMSTSVRMIEYPTENSCLDELATMRNSDSDMRTQAIELIQSVESDVKQFYKTVVVK